MTFKVYFGCSMRGGHPHVSFEDLAEMARVIEELGFCLESNHQTNRVYLENDKKRHDNFVHDRDYEWMKEADFGVFEISNPSLGTGAEISDMANMEKPILCLFRVDLRDKVSKYVTGKHGSNHIKSKFESYGYQTLGDAKYAIRKFASELEKVKSL